MKKAIVFDFDGTLTKKGQNIWKMLWESCGYPTDKTSLYATLYVRHVIKKEISRKDWFDLTCKAFQEKNLDFYNFYEVSKKIELIDGFHETVKKLYDNGYMLFINSGCIKEAIEIALGKSAKYFTYIESNQAIFNQDGKLEQLVPTDFDYEGKADFIEIIKKQLDVNPENIVFVGNSDNDEWTYQTGCRTICINPDKADYKDSQKWHYVIEKLINLNEICKFLNIDEKLF